MDSVKVGYAFSGFRNDGRYFVGVVESVKPTTKGTLVVLHTVEAIGPGQVRTVFKSFHVEAMSNYSCQPSDHWPAGMTRADYIDTLTGKGV